MSKKNISYLLINLFLFLNGIFIYSGCCCNNSINKTSTDAYEEDRKEIISLLMSKCKDRYDGEIKEIKKIKGKKIEEEIEEKKKKVKKDKYGKEVIVKKVIEEQIKQCEEKPEKEIEENNISEIKKIKKDNDSDKNIEDLKTKNIEENINQKIERMLIKISEYDLEIENNDLEIENNDLKKKTYLKPNYLDKIFEIFKDSDNTVDKMSDSNIQQSDNDIDINKINFLLNEFIEFKKPLEEESLLKNCVSLFEKYKPGSNLQENIDKYCNKKNVLKTILSQFIENKKPGEYMLKSIYNLILLYRWVVDFKLSFKKKVNRFIESLFIDLLSVFNSILDKKKIYEINFYNEVNSQSNDSVGKLIYLLDMFKNGEVNIFEEYDENNKIKENSIKISFNSLENIRNILSDDDIKEKKKNMKDLKCVITINKQQIEIDNLDFRDIVDLMKIIICYKNENKDNLEDDKLRFYLHNCDFYILCDFEKIVEEWLRNLKFSNSILFPVESNDVGFNFLWNNILSKLCKNKRDDNFESQFTFSDSNSMKILNKIDKCITENYNDQSSKEIKNTFNPIVEKIEDKKKYFNKIIKVCYNDEKETFILDNKEYSIDEDDKTKLKDLFNKLNSIVGNYQKVYEDLEEDKKEKEELKKEYIVKKEEDKEKKDKKEEEELKKEDIVKEEEELKKEEDENKKNIIYYEKKIKEIEEKISNNKNNLIEKIIKLKNNGKENKETYEKKSIMNLVKIYIDILKKNEEKQKKKNGCHIF